MLKENMPFFDNALTFNYTWMIACALGVLSWLVFRSVQDARAYSAIPAVGNSGLLSSYIDAIRFIKHGGEILQEGYDKYHPQAFRFAELNRWHIVVTSQEMIEELRKAKDEDLSLDVAVTEDLASDYTLGPNVFNNDHHVPMIRRLTRNLGNLFGDVKEELALAFETFIPATEEWTPVRAFETVQNIVSRTSNRIFVGAPLCRDLDWIKLNVQFTMDLTVGSKILYPFPNILKPIAARLFTNVPASIQRGMKHLQPVIEERKQLLETLGDEYKMPNDMLAWLMEEAKGEEASVRNLTLRVLSLNFGAINTSSLTFTHALFSLAASPASQITIREEVTNVVAQEGWNKAAMARMRKLDSFLKESHRMMGLGSISMLRKALKSFTFSDGTHIPAGALVSAACTPRHLDETIYGPDARKFDGFRFSNMREGAGEGTKNQLVATSTDFLTFGHGRHACPGRFFAANELKAMMAHIVLTYDIKLDAEPKSLWFGTAIIPDPKGEVLFRKRR